jgi:hypothetical protein
MAKASPMEVSPEVTQSPAKAGPEHHPEPHDAHPQGHYGDPSNPIYFGLPIGVIIAATISAISVGITLLKFFYFK